MSEEDMKTIELMEITEQLWKLVDIWMGEGKDPLSICAGLTTCGMKLYKTVLDEDDYNQMMDAISNSRDKVSRLGESRGMH